MNPWIGGPNVDPANVAITGGSITGVTGVPTLFAQSWASLATPGDTSEDTLVTITIPGGTLRANDSLLVEAFYTQTNSANNKTVRIRWGAAGSGTIVAANTFSTVAGGQLAGSVANANATNSQNCMGPGFTTAGISYMPPATASLDTTASQTVVISGQKVSSGESLVLVGYRVWLIRA